MFLVCVVQKSDIFQLQKRSLNGYNEGQVIPHFELKLKLNSQQSFEQEVHFTGTEAYITLTREPIQGMYNYIIIAGAESIGCLKSFSQNHRMEFTRALSHQLQFFVSYYFI